MSCSTTLKATMFVVTQAVMTVSQTWYPSVDSEVHVSMTLKMLCLQKQMLSKLAFVDAPQISN